MIRPQGGFITLPARIAAGWLFTDAIGSPSDASLKNLVKRARCDEKSEQTGETAGIPIVCDTDENDPHVNMLERWLEEDPDHHHAALTRPRLEYWFILHYESPGARTPSTPGKSSNASPPVLHGEVIAAIGHRGQHGRGHRTGEEPAALHRGGRAMADSGLLPAAGTHRLA
ncbi:hypothetical protein [uncultured Propionibacterium sp.]|uniref:hypothetical protein n=1 Tax=uncultured Propionibacterium sp. TaxID=218066 RepID=UPI00293055B7|nr:hypothetical protein [uncultured Propionibacterium sp.]